MYLQSFYLVSSILSTCSTYVNYLNLIYLYSPTHGYSYSKEALFQRKNSASFFTETVPSPAGCSFPNRSIHISGYRRFQRTFDAFQQTYFQFHIDFFPFHRITPITPVKRNPAIGMSATDSISEPSLKKLLIDAQDSIYRMPHVPRSPRSSRCVLFL